MGSFFSVIIAVIIIVGIEEWQQARGTVQTVDNSPRRAAADLGDHRSNDEPSWWRLLV